MTPTERTRGRERRHLPIRKIYPEPGENPLSPSHLSKRLLNGVANASSEGCWTWMRSAKRSGHATMTVAGRTVPAYRVAFEVWVGPIPNGQWVLHRCDNPRCIRPDHLELGDQTKNMADCSRRGRAATGARNGQAKLTQSGVDEMRRLRSDGWTQARLASRFGVTQATVWRAVNRRSWR